MLLAIDVGNTHTVIGVYRDDTLVADWRMASLTHRTGDENWLTLKNFCTDAGIDPAAIKAVGISSVVPDLTFVFEHLARKHFGVEPVTITGALDFGVQHPLQRSLRPSVPTACAMPLPALRNTAGRLSSSTSEPQRRTTLWPRMETISAVSSRLGLESTAAELHRRAAKLPRIELRFPSSAIGNDTASSMQSGVLFGNIDAVEGMVKRIRAELGAPARVIATGGLARDHRRSHSCHRSGRAVAGAGWNPVDSGEGGEEEATRQ